MVKLILLRHHSQLQMEKTLKLSVVCQMLRQYPLVDRSQTHKFRDECAKKSIGSFQCISVLHGHVSKMTAHQLSRDIWHLQGLNNKN